MRRQKRTNSDIVEESHFSDTTYNSAYVSFVLSLIAKNILQTIFSYFVLIQDNNLLGEIWKFFENFAS